MSEVRDNLITARALIADEENWLQGDNHRVIDGRDCYCSYGALQQVLGGELDITRTYEYLALTRAIQIYMVKDIAFVGQFNDTHPHNEVLQVWDFAIDMVVL